MSHNGSNINVSQEEKELILADSIVEEVAFVKGVVFSVENMTSGNSVLKSINSPLKIHC